MVHDSAKKVPRSANTVVDSAVKMQEGMLFVAVQAIVLPLVTILSHEMVKKFATLLRDGLLRIILL